MATPNERDAEAMRLAWLLATSVARQRRAQQGVWLPVDKLLPSEADAEWDMRQRIYPDYASPRRVARANLEAKLRTGLHDDANGNAPDVWERQ